MKSIEKRIKAIEKIIKVNKLDTDDITMFLNELIPGNKKSLAEILAELDTDTLRAIRDSDEPGEVLAQAIRKKKSA